MSIKSLYREYFQKSRVFLYPALEIKKGSSVTPIQTYSAWKDNVKYGDKKLVCLYHLRNDPEYRAFEKNKLFGNKLFDDFKEVDDNKGIYIFNFSSFGKDWDHFLKGKYSKISPELKRKIRDFFKGNSNYVYADSFIQPEKYYPIYADLLGTRIEILKEVGELCSAPDLDKETIEVTIKNLEINPTNNQKL
jgi:hypothetical protein